MYSVTRVFFAFFFCETVSCIPGLLGTHCVSDNDFELLILLNAGSTPVYWCWGTEPRASCLVGKHSTNWATPSARIFLFYGECIVRRFSSQGLRWQTQSVLLGSFHCLPLLYREEEKNPKAFLGAVVLTHIILLSGIIRKENGGQGRTVRW